MGKTRSPLSFIFITLLIDSIGIGIIIPVVPALIQELTGGSISEASFYGGWMAFVYAFMQFICAPVIGGLSDKFGRRPVLLSSLLGLGIDYIFLALAPTIFWLFIGRVISGIFGASFTSATAYIADISSPEKRAQNFGLVGAAFGIGFILGPVIGGIAAEWGTRFPFIIAAALSLLNFIYGYFILPESLKKENRREFEWKRANPIGSLLHLKKYPELPLLMLAIFLLHLAGQAPPSVWTYYTMFKFDWDEKMVGYSLGAVGLLLGLVQGGLIRKIIPWLGQHKTVYYGLLFSILSYTLFAFAQNTMMMFAFIIPFGLSGLAGPAIQGIVSNKIPENEQGEIQGSITSLISLSAIIGPLVMTGLFYYYTEGSTRFIFPGAPFILSALLNLIALLLIYKRLQRFKQES